MRNEKMRNEKGTLKLRLNAQNKTKIGETELQGVF